MWSVEGEGRLAKSTTLQQKPYLVKVFIFHEVARGVRSTQKYVYVVYGWSLVQ